MQTYPNNQDGINTTIRALLQQCWIWYAKPVNIQCSYLLCVVDDCAILIFKVNASPAQHDNLPLR
nr:MAG TPA_asm: hypothetical protein [Caudoviricetes sp.]